MDTRVVLLSGHVPWSPHKQTPHYIAEFLGRTAKSASVIYIEPPIAWSSKTPWFELERCTMLVRKRLRQVGERIWVYTPAALPFGRLGWTLAMNRKLLIAGLRRAMQRLGEPDPTLWLAETDASQTIRDLYPEAPCIFHAIDYFTHPGQAEAARRLAQHSDIVLAASPLIAESYAQVNTKVYVFRNGWEFPENLGTVLPPRQLGSIPRPRVGLVTFLGPNLDYELLYKLVSTLPISLVVIGRRIGALGPDEAILNRLLAHPRVYYLGERSTDSLPGLIEACDLCVAPYKQNKRIYASDPLKIYQYLALGKPVVVTPVHVLESLPIVDVGRTPDEFVRIVEQKLACGPDPELTLLRKAAASKATWLRRWCELCVALSENDHFASLLPASLGETGKRFRQ